MVRLRLYSVSDILLGSGRERACLGRYFEVCWGFDVAQGDMAIEQVTMEICWHVFGRILGDFARIFTSYLRLKVEGQTWQANDRRLVWAF